MSTNWYRTLWPFSESKTIYNLYPRDFQQRGEYLYCYYHVDDVCFYDIPHIGKIRASVTDGKWSLIINGSSIELVRPDVLIRYGPNNEVVNVIYERL